MLSSSRFSQTQRSPHVFYRHDLINQLQHNHALVTLVAENLATYMESMRLYARGRYFKLIWTNENKSMFSSQLFWGGINYLRNENKCILPSFVSLWSTLPLTLMHPKLQASISRLFTKCLPSSLSLLNWFLFLPAWDRLCLPVPRLIVTFLGT